MGSWHGTCGVTQLPIRHGDPIALLLLNRTHAETVERGPSGYCYANAWWAPRALPVYGVYDDAGGIENFEEDWNTHFIVETLRQDVVEMEEGENPYWDVPVSRADLTFPVVLDLIVKGRLFVHQRTQPDMPTTQQIGYMLIHRFAYDFCATGESSRARAFSLEGDGKEFYQFLLDLPEDEYGLRGLDPVTGDLPSVIMETTMFRNRLRGFLRPSTGFGIDSIFTEHGLRDYGRLLGRFALTKTPFDDPALQTVLAEMRRITIFDGRFMELRRTYMPQSSAGSQDADYDLYLALTENVADWLREAKRDFDEED